MSSSTQHGHRMPNRSTVHLQLGESRLLGHSRLRYLHIHSPKYLEHTKPRCTGPSSSFDEGSRPVALASSARSPSLGLKASARCPTAPEAASFRAVEFGFSLSRTSSCRGLIAVTRAFGGGGGCGGGRGGCGGRGGGGNGGTGGCGGPGGQGDGGSGGDDGGGGLGGDGGGGGAGAGDVGGGKGGEGGGEHARARQTRTCPLGLYRAASCG